MALAKEEIEAILRKHCAQLSEHFDTVQIFVTRQEGADTGCSAYGTGNWFARFGQVKLWARANENDSHIRDA